VAPETRHMRADPEERRRRTNSALRSVYDYVMGALWLGLGIVFVWHEKFGFELDLDPTLKLIFGIAAILYGAFRLYRGYRKTG